MLAFDEVIPNGIGSKGGAMLTGIIRPYDRSADMFVSDDLIPNFKPLGFIWRLVAPRHGMLPQKR
jgi:hypothetical protein